MIKFNVAKMFSHREPWDCSNSVANLGQLAGEFTWTCSLEVARNHEQWLMCPLSDALDFICTWAKETGAWDREEIAAWTQDECLALLVQNVASDMRMLGSDDRYLTECVDAYDAWDHSYESPQGMYRMLAGDVIGEMHS